jgi:hypothetical protein
MFKNICVKKASGGFDLDPSVINARVDSMRTCLAYCSLTPE